MNTNYLSPKSNVIFKRIFGDEKNIDILSGFLQAVLDIPKAEMAKIEIVDSNMRQEGLEDKRSILDLKLKTAGGISIDIEMELLNIPELKERIVFYTSNMVTAQLASCVNYGETKRAITIVIADFNFVNDSNTYHHVYRLYDEANKSLLTNLVEINILELPKLQEQEENIELWRWMQFFKAERNEDFEMLAEKNKDIGKAVAVLAELSQDEKMRLAYEYEEKARRDYVSRIDGAKKEALFEVARNMKENGIENSMIITFTKLTEDEVNSL